MASQGIGKVKAFSLSGGGSSTSKLLNKKEVERAKKQADEEAAAAAYEQFVATFDAPKPTGKLFVRGNVINPNSGEEVAAAGGKQTAGSLYKPEKLQELEKRLLLSESKPKPSASAAYNPKFNEKPPKKKGDAKKKLSNLEAFKEELKMLQKEREARQRARTQGGGKDSGGKPSSAFSSKSASTSLYDDEDGDDDTTTSNSQEDNANISTSSIITSITSSITKGAPLSSSSSVGSHDTGDPNTTNIYLGNLHPKLTEDQLCEVFGRYGPLASVKIMWPRTEEERTRNRNCGFVAFMARKDGERAMRAINGRPLLDYEMRLGWGKSVPIPATPIYIPPALRALTVPPPPSGLPFNAQLEEEADRRLLAEQYAGDPKRLFREDRPAFEALLSRALVKVVKPAERPLLATINRTVEFVIREGPMFEAVLMAREVGNPLYAFLFDNQSPGHVYYRWRLFSILQGDHPSSWRLEEFRMFTGGSRWRPPPISLYQAGMPEALLPADPQDGVDLLQQLSSNSTADDRRGSTGDSDGAGDGRGKRGGGKGKRYNSSADVASNSKKGLLREADREDFEDGLRSLTPQRAKIAQLMVFAIEHADAWEEIIECIADSLLIDQTPLFKKVARLYLISDILNNCTAKVANASNYRRGLQAKLGVIFEAFHRAYRAIEGRLKAEQFKQRVMSCFRAWEEMAIFSSEFLIKLQNVFLGLDLKEKERKAAAAAAAAAAAINAKAVRTIDGAAADDEELDGVPLDDADDLDGEEIGFPSQKSTTTATTPATLKFKPSKWETIDPEVVESQAITTSKWEHLDRGVTGAAGAAAASASSAASLAASVSIYDDDDFNDDEEDIDGKPMDDDEPDYFETLGVSKTAAASSSSLPSTSGHHPHHHHQPPTASSSVSSSLAAQLSRETLREIELKVLQYMDDREKADRRSGSRSRTAVNDQQEEEEEEFSRVVEKYREELMRKAVASASTTSTSSSSSGRRSRSPPKSRSPPLLPPPSRLRHSSTSSSTSSHSHHHYKSSATTASTSSRYQSSPPPAPSARQQSRSRSPPSKRRK